MSRPACAIIDTAAFVANYRHAKTLAPHARALAVVKANAYGHGAVELALVLDSEADGFGVACTEEAVELREAGVTRPIVLLEGVFEPDELMLASQLQLAVGIHSHTQLNWLEHAQLPHPLRVWLKLDTGMHRLGFAAPEIAAVRQRLLASTNVAGLVLMSHFARADEPECRYTAHQLTLFRETVAAHGDPLSLANSAAVMAWPDSHCDWVRPGIMLYGSSPLADDEGVSLRPVMRLQSRLIAIRELAAGEAIGYGGRYVCARPTRVGTVAIGYADGYPRHAPDGTPVVVDGQRTRLIGRVSMDMLTVDLSDLPNAGIGAPVELWGENLPANEIAAHCGTIAYELFTRITRRVQRRYA